MMAARQGGEPRISRATIGFYAVAAFSTTLLSYPIVVFLPQLYIKELGLSIAGVGLVITLTQVLDAVNQQVLGMLSDRTRSRWGSRKPWIAFGATLAVVAAFFLLKPPPGIGLLYFAAWKIVYDFAWTAKTVAYTAWGAELSTDYRTRSNVLGASGLATELGGLGNNLLPIVVAGLGLAASARFTMTMMGYYFVAGAILVPALHAVTLAFTPRGAQVALERPTVLGMVDSVRRNRPFQLYLAAFMLSGLANGATQISFTFYDSYLHVGKWLSYMFTALAVANVLSIPCWVWLSNIIGKHKACALSLLLLSAGIAMFGLINPETNSQAFIIEVTAFVVILIGFASGGGGSGAGSVLAQSMLGDIADYGTWKTGIKRTASYFAFYLLTTKVAAAVGAGMAFMALSGFGYNAKAGTTNTHWAKVGIVIIFVVAPTILRLLSALVMWWFPLNERRHTLISLRLAKRDRRQTAPL